MTGNPKISDDQKPEDCVVDVQGVSKTYCRNLRRSLWYGVQDIYREMTLRPAYTGRLRVDEFEAVRNASFQVGRGECVALIGPNGAGKSTMLKMINGILRPSQGQIRINGRVSALIELGTGFNPILTGRENVFINASVLGFSKSETEERFDEILEFSEIGEFIDAPVRTYSSGMKVRLGFAVASHLAPDLMLIDEVLAVGDLAFRMKCYEHLQNRVAQGVSVILVSHIVSMMPRFCTRAVVFRQGEIAFDGDIMEGIIEYQKILGIEKAEAQQFDNEMPMAISQSKSPKVNDPDRDEDKGEPDERKANATGIPEVQIAAIKTLDTNLEKSESFATDDSIVVEVEFSATNKYENCKLVLNLESASYGLISCMASQKQGFKFDIVPGQDNFIRIRLGRVPLIDGSYILSATLYGDGKSNLLDQKSSLASFRILNEGKRKRALKGILVMEPDWETNLPDESDVKIPKTDQN